MNYESGTSVFFVLMLALVLLTIFGIVYLYINAKTKERLALIERGMDPNLARSDFWIQIGIVGGGAALGLIIGDVIPGEYGPLVAILFAGGALVLYNLLRRSRASRSKDNV